MGLKITVLDTGPKTYTEELARKEVLNRVFGVTSAVMANNGTTETKRKTKNKVLSIAIDSKEITPDKIMVYKAKLDEKDKTTLKADLRAIKFGFWLEDKDKKEVKLHENVAYIIRSNKEKRYLFDITTKDDLASTDHTTDFTDTETIEEFTIALGKHAFYYAKITRTETEAILEIKFSKWMDGYRIRMEAYYRSEKPLGDGGTTTASRFVWANPEIIDTYWMNAQGKRIQETGHSQDLYLYLKTLGLTDRTITVNVYDKDYHRKPLEPSNFLGNNNGDDLIEWNNNQLKIDKREIIKQFKVGNKKRYEEAKKDETEKEYQKWYDEQIDKGLYFVGFDPIEKYGNNLELYINFPKQENLNLPRDNAFAKLVLTEKERIAGAFFAKVEKHKVQADAPASKKKPNPTTKATQYIKIDKGVLGQTVQLVAECPNLEGKTVTFQVFEKTPLLGEKDKALTLIHKDQEKTCIEAKVENGYAVAEIKLQHCKEDADNEDWLDILKNGFYDTKGKTAEIYIKAEIYENVFTFKAGFTQETTFKMIGNNWHEPVDDPQIAIYTQYGAENTHKNTYGTARGYTHAGLDIFALEGSNVYACLDAEVYEIQKWTRKTGESGYGHNVTLEVKIPQEVRNRRREYTLAYKTDKKQGNSFDPNSNIFYLRYAHLEDILVKKGDKVKAGQVIAKSGISGVIEGTKDPHLHFNIYSDVKSNAYLVNPAYYVYWKEIGDLTEVNKKVQKDRMEQGLKVDPAPKLSKIK